MVQMILARRETLFGAGVSSGVLLLRFKRSLEEMIAVRVPTGAKAPASGSHLTRPLKGRSSTVSPTSPISVIPREARNPYARQYSLGRDASTPNELAFAASFYTQHD